MCGAITLWLAPAFLIAAASASITARSAPSATSRPTARRSSVWVQNGLAWLPVELKEQLCLAQRTSSGMLIVV